MSVRRLLTIACLFLLRSGVAEEPADFAAEHRIGESYIRKKDYRTAALHLRAAYRLNPADYDNAFDLAEAELRAGNPAGALTVLNELLARQDRAELHHLLGECEEARGRLREAIAQYQVAARSDESEPNLFSFGSALLRANAPAEAQKIFKYAGARFARSARIQVGLGIAQYASGDYNGSVETLCRAVDLDPADTRALEFLGKMPGVAPALGSDVSSRLKHFVTVYPENAAANYYYAKSLRATPSAPNQPLSGETAETYLQRAVTLSPAFVDAHYELGLVKEERGDNRSAMEHYQRAIQLQPGLLPAHYHLAQLYRKAGRIEEAEHEYQTVRALSEKH